jgi:hypothetical protein
VPSGSLATAGLFDAASASLIAGREEGTTLPRLPDARFWHRIAFAVVSGRIAEQKRAIVCRQSSPRSTRCAKGDADGKGIREQVFRPRLFERSDGLLAIGFASGMEDDDEQNEASSMVVPELRREQRVVHSVGRFRANFRLERKFKWTGTCPRSSTLKVQRPTSSLWDAGADCWRDLSWILPACRTAIGFSMSVVEQAA